MPHIPRAQFWKHLFQQLIRYIPAPGRFVNMALSEMEFHGIVRQGEPVDGSFNDRVYCLIFAPMNVTMSQKLSLLQATRSVQ